jgi:hypothetical protein
VILRLEEALILRLSAGANDQAAWPGKPSFDLVAA